MLSRQAVAVAPFIAGIRVSMVTVNFVAIGSVFVCSRIYPTCLHDQGVRPCVMA